MDLLVGHQTRAHADLDVLILRPDQHRFRLHLENWDLHAADPPGSLRPWPVGEVLPRHVHDVWCRRDASAPWSFQFVIDDIDGDDWMFRRDNAIRRPVVTLSGRASRPGMPVLAAEVQLLYKSKGMRDKDAIDFEMVLRYLGLEEREWLRLGLLATQADHQWIEVSVQLPAPPGGAISEIPPCRQESRGVVAKVCTWQAMHPRPRSTSAGSRGWKRSSPSSPR